MKRLAILFVLISLVTSFGYSQNNFWKDVQNRNIVLPAFAERRINPQKFRTLELNMDALKRELHQAPKGELTRSLTGTPTLQMPLPDGSSIEMQLIETPLMPVGLSTRYPNIKAFKGIATDGSNTTGWFDYGVQGFHGVIYLPKGTVYIDPYATNQQEYYMAYFTKDHVLNQEERATYQCLVEEELEEETEVEVDKEIYAQDKEVDLFRSPSEPITLRSYRLALAVTGEYSGYHATGGSATKAASLSAMVTAINRANSVFERDIAVRLLLIEDTDEVIFLDRFNDPYTNGNTGAMINENPPVLDTAFTRFGYDIGHVLGTNAGGLAQLAAVCGGGKARGVTCHGNPIGDNFYIDYICHEVGHQFGAAHTFNNCGGNESSGTAYEPGSGSTIMSYSGLCGSDNIQFSSGDYFHVASLDQMIRFSRQSNGNNCGSKTPTSNNTPEVTIPLADGFYIPIGTPFELEGSAIDQDGDSIRYNWEQFDLGPIGRPLGTAINNSPLFRSVLPNGATNRVFPSLDQILLNEVDPREVLPDYSRDMTFRLTARDYHPEGGGVDWATLKFKATDQAGPFLVSYPTAGSDTLEVGQYIEIKWDVANTDQALVNCKNVNILLSLDGGRTFPIEWAMNTANDGSEFVLVPEMTTPFGRVKIEAADNIFFDISNFDFTIAPPSQPGYSLAISSNYEQVCLPAFAKFDIVTSSLLAYDSLIELSVVSDLPEGANIEFANNPILPSEQTEMTIDMSAVSGNQVFDVVLQAVAANADTSYRTITLDVVSNDFSSFEMMAPADGSSGMSGLPEFNWLPAADADAYNIEIATSPTFEASTIIDAGQGITDTLYQPGLTLEENTLYYWRVQPTNRCGEAPVSFPKAFHTESIDCGEVAADNVPINISATGTPKIQSVITVTADGVISDLNIPVLKGSHDLVKHLDVKLIGPDGTEVVLFSDLCGNTSFFNLGLDDEGPTEIPCPPLGASLHQPQNPLSEFDGKSTKGDWTLEAEVINTAGEGGAIDGWTIEFCSNISLSNPLLVLNDTMPINPNTSRFVSNTFLLVEDENNVSSELLFTLVGAPINGRLEVEGTPIAIGDQFTQKQINNFGINYIHDGSDTNADNFYFTVIDGSGGWTGTHQFNIVIDENIMVSTEELLNVPDFKLFPNPTNGDVTLRFEEASNLPTGQAGNVLPIRVFDARGVLIREFVFDRGQRELKMDLEEWGSGIYFLQLQLGGQVISRRVVKF